MPTNNLYFSDIPGGCVYRRSPDGTIETLVTGRRMIGGLALHADGGFVMSGPTVAHWRDGDVRVLLDVDGVNSFNDIQPDGEGRIYAGAIRSEHDRPQGAEGARASATASALDGTVDELYGDLEVSNGIGFSPDGRTIYHVDSTTKGIWVHDVGADGSVSNRRHIGDDVFARGIPDGMCVDADGNLWVAHVGGRRVVKLSPTGDQLDRDPGAGQGGHERGLRRTRPARTCTSSPPTTSSSRNGAARCSVAARGRPGSRPRWPGSDVLCHRTGRWRPVR